jgi:hypothetical protein
MTEAFFRLLCKVVCPPRPSQWTPALSAWRRHQGEDHDPASSRAVAEYLSFLDDAAFSRATPVEPKAISPTDPAARYTASANSVAAYAYSDSDFGGSARGEGGGAQT